MSLLQVENLTVQYKLPTGYVNAIENVSFSLEEGEALGVIGESGCGKTTLMKAVLRLLADNGRIASGHIRFRGTDLVPLSTKELAEFRWNEISVITQSSMNALNPVAKVGDQIAEVLTIKGGMSRQDAWQRAGELFAIVGLEAKRLHDYPHQLSGGMRQRTMIAMALALNPSLVIADEPTTALDVVVQARILQQMAALQTERQMALMFVTHDIAVVAGLCKKAMVMYAGQIAEIGTTEQIFKRPVHPYTMGLHAASPNVRESISRLISIPGSPPDLRQPPPGCRFAPRCIFATDRCHTEAPAMKEVEPGHFAACHYTDRAEEMRAQAAEPAQWEGVQA